MGTIRQKKLAKAIVENMASKKPKTAGQLLENVGYAENTATGIPSVIIESKGVQEELIELGFSEDRAKRVVAKIMNSEEIEPNTRLKAADMTFKIHGSYAPEKSTSVDIQIKGDVKDFEKYDAVRLKYEEELRASLIN